MIYLLSDPHAGLYPDGMERYLSICGKDDLLLLLGDTELNFRDTPENAEFTRWFLSLEARIAIVDGNHENHPFLCSFPEEEWNGAPVHRLTDSIVHLERGYIYDIGGASFFVMGGCKSSAKWYEQGLVFDGEEPDETEVARGFKNLEERGNAVDYVLTHQYRPEKWQNEEPERLSLAGISKFIDESVDFRRWYIGHWHKNRTIDERHTIVFDMPLELGKTYRTT